MTIRDLLNKIEEIAYNTEGIRSIYTSHIMNTDIIIDGDRSEYKINEIIYDRTENKFHLKVEEEG